jgi:hypothetical protein
MKKFVMLAVAMLFAAAPALVAADKTWNGKLTDTRCKDGKHSKDEHPTVKGDHDCAAKCLAGGEKSVFLSGGKTYTIANQDFAGLKDHAGHSVALTGEMKGDTITVSKIEMKGEAKGKKKK